MVKKNYMLLLIVMLLCGCATYTSKYANPKDAADISSKKEVLHTFYLIGDAGFSPIGSRNPVLKSFKNTLGNASENSTAIFLGDNVYPAGLPKKSNPNYNAAKSHLDAQLGTLEGYKGSPLFIPGNHDWYANGLEGVARQEDYIKDYLDDKNAFLPKNGCPLTVVDVNDAVAILVIDTHWYLTDWDTQPNINDACDIKSRGKFFLALEGAIKDNRHKTTLIAMHHPMTSYGNHGGQFSFEQQFYPKKGLGPLPVLGTLGNVLRATSGVSNADMQHKRYRELIKRVTTLAQYSEKVIFASGHEHSLQYIVENNTPQIVSGSGAKKGVASLRNGSAFASGNRGYATLEVYVDGSSRVRFYGVDDYGREQFLFTSAVLSPNDTIMAAKTYPKTFPKTVQASVYTNREITKGNFYTWFWGERYRAYYGTKVTAPTVTLDTLFGGLVPVKKGGGHQSKSLRLRDTNGKEYVMRALRKSAELYLQSMAFQDQYVLEDLKETYTQEILQDFYTGAHPYAPFVVGKLSDAVGIYHTNPTLYYVPKQKTLGAYNDVFGDELYMIEEHAGDGHGGLESFGFSDNLKSTNGLLQDLREDEKYTVNTNAYIRARLFDMLVGDWDRHVDQWRWAAFKTGDSITYKPIPRDRDQVFSKMGDGAFMSVATRSIPGLKLMEGFNEEIRNVKGFNSSPKTYVLDLALLTQTTKQDWREQALYLQQHLNDDDIDAAFLGFPAEVRGETTTEIKRILLSRLKGILKTAETYYDILNKYAVVTGTDKDDWFEIERLDDSRTQVKGYRNIGGKRDKKFFDKVFYASETKEIWVYGLDDDDVFQVRNNEGYRGTKVRLIGGKNNDVYHVNNGKGVFIYDYKSGSNTFKETIATKITLTDDYETNTYLPLAIRNSTNQMVPAIGFNPDDGMRIGFLNTYTYNGFRQDPFTQKHELGAAFYFATSGFDVSYTGEFANLFEHWNLELKGRFTSPNFAINFFGIGNDTENLDNDLGLDYNRVRIKSLSVAPSLVWRGSLGAKFRTGLSYEAIAVEETDNRFVNTFYQENGAETENNFVGVHGEYTYENKDSAAFPTMGMATSLAVGYKSNITNSAAGFGYLIPSLALDYKLVSDGRLVLATKWKAHLNIGNGYEFFQAATIGGIDGLRGFRNQRFTGKTAYYQNTDIRYSLKKMRTSVLPATLGVFAGYDYGRVWTPEFESNQWHTSYGAGVFVNGSDILSANLALFNSAEGVRLVFGLGFAF